jgi:hypothetical protein
MNAAQPDDSTALAAGTEPRCRNCSALLAGRYCSQCGQAADVHVPSTQELVHEALEGLTHSDSRLWRTLACLWFKPGKLTCEYIAGRRAAYLPPFRLYLIVSVLFFFLASIGHQRMVVLQMQGNAAVQVNPQEMHCENVNFLTQLGHPEWNARLVHACQVARSDDAASLDHLIMGIVPKAMFVLLPLVALLHMLMYWWPRHRYAEHLLFFLHIHAFFFSIAVLSLAADAAAQAWPAARPVADIAHLLLFWSLLIYTVAAMRRVFRRSWPGTLFKAAALSMIYVIVLGLTMGAVSLYAALQL